MASSEGSDSVKDAAGRDWIDVARKQTERTRRILESTPPLPPPESFPGYTIIREVHRGGQGIVYEALQQSTGQRVALKVIRDASLAGPREKARFEREVEILAQLDHPNIVGIRDSGVTSGRYFFVMQFVEGEAIDVYVRRAQRSVHDVLQLFEHVCNAIQAAHLRGIVHRDLKPSNIVVGRDGCPFVLDFGAATLRGEQASPAAGITHTGEFVGSFPWASPEQAEGRSGDIDVRTDVYALGVVLFHCLTGKFPYPVAGSMQEVLGHISHTEPKRPSSLWPKLEIDVDWVVLKCLAKESNRRYQSAGELASDLRRYLCGQPVDAGAPSTFYTLKKLARRNRPLVVGSSIALFALVVGTSAATWAAINARRERDRAQAAERRVGSVLEIFQGVLASPDPAQQGPEAKVVDALRIAEDLLAVPERVEPEVAARLRRILGQTYLGLGEYELAKGNLEQAVGKYRSIRPLDEVSIASTLCDLARTREELGEYDGAVSIAREAVALAERASGRGHPSIAEGWMTLAKVLLTANEPSGDYSEAEGLAAQALEVFRSRFGDEDKRTAEAMGLLGELKAAPQLAEARNLITGAEVPLNEEAREYLSQACEVLKNVAGATHPLTLRFAHHPLLISKGSEELRNDEVRRKELERTLLARVAMRERRFGAEHPATAWDLYNLATFYSATEDYHASEEFHQRALDIRRRKLREGHPLECTSMNDLAYVKIELGKPAEATALFQAIIPDEIARYGPEHVRPTLQKFNIGAILETEKKWDEAERWHREVLEIRRKTLGEEHDDTLLSRRQVAVCIRRQGRLEEAEPLYRELLADFQRKYGPAHDYTLIVHPALGELLVDLGRLSEAHATLDEALAQANSRSNFPPGHKFEIHVRFARCLTREGRFAEAEAQLRSLLQLRNVLGDPDGGLLSRIKTGWTDLLAQSGQAEEQSEFARILAEESAAAEHATGATP